MDSKREVILYVVFGVLTTAINIVTYLFCTKLLQIEYKLATTIAWIVSVLFAFVTNKLYVFRSKESSMRFVLKEMFLFFIARLFSYGLDIGTMLLLVAQMHMNDFIAKCVANVVVILVNYFISKYVIFKKQVSHG
ncbi:GtrA family protein [Ectobacillus funiculus]|uniref:GtrA family protein n=1 Tax=Ectobacillus funiculus TaxID=137993 RepID=UPI00101DF624|nr:GtrA family protein [Ectobacillus funiculus]